jgi:hypothetical protein
MIVAQQKFLSEIFAEHPKFCILDFEFWIFVSVSNFSHLKFIQNSDLPVVCLPCLPAGRLLQRKKSKQCHCEERSDEAISLNKL